MIKPILRFEYFNQCWEEYYLGEISSKIGSGSTPKGGASVYCTSGIPFIRSQNINNNSLQLDDIVYIPTELNEKMKSSKVKPNDILLNITGASIGRSCVAPLYFTQGNVNQHVCIIRLTHGNPKFFQSYLSSSKGQELINGFQSGSGREGLNFQNIKSMRIFAPTIEEQNKIADFLSSVDEKIALQSSKVELLRQYKKGILQKLFSQKIRFKDSNGIVFPKWTRQSISDIAEVNPKSKVLPDDFIYIDLESVQSGRLVQFKKMSKIDAPSRAQRLLKFDDVLFQLVRPYQKNNLHFREQQVCVASTGYVQLRAKCNAAFLFQLLHLDGFTDQVMNRCTGTSYPAINSSDLASIQCEIPCLEEQRKIANFLVSIDDKINLENTKLDKLKQWKQGLLQQMFV
ncbi:restriction endonuclease subunit S [Providencia manganoxydans]|uniref:restriction endonuclease subunit S n=1 Tax=Providencia manganoxydans TaxID=2923283 RepID=UPI0029C01D63|nr:restriction endonuclease subunit S [Providencia manganoxydans]MDX4945473.1 restriction endonuclease subunit S [Providencia manganoxydans]